METFKVFFVSVCDNSDLCSHREIFELDNYSPIPVETEEEYKLVVSRFPFHDAEIEKVMCSSTTISPIWHGCIHVKERFPKRQLVLDEC